MSYCRLIEQTTPDLLQNFPQLASVTFPPLSCLSDTPSSPLRLTVRDSKASNSHANKPVKKANCSSSLYDQKAFSTFLTAIFGWRRSTVDAECGETPCPAGTWQHLLPEVDSKTNKTTTATKQMLNCLSHISIC